MAGPLPRLAVVPMLAPTAPRLTHLTREFVNRVMELCRDYYSTQSGGRAGWTFQVFDWYRIRVQDISQAYFDDELPKQPGEKLGDLVLPWLARDIGLNVSQFTHFAFILDHPKVGPEGAWFPPGARRYLHIGAPDLDPSLIAHELGHMFGLGHTYLDVFPRLPQQYKDRFCIMGAGYTFAKVRDQLNQPISFRADFGDLNWYRCNRCAGTYRARPTDVSLCPGSPPGTGHQADTSTVFNPRREPPSAATDEESGWRLCGDCGAMFFDGAADKGQCPAGGGHQAAAAGVPMVLRHGTTPITRCEVGGWQQCGKCRVLYRGGDAATSSCPVTVPTSGHEPIAGGRSYVLPFDDDHNEWGPGFCAPMLAAARWLDPAHGVDIGAQLRSRPATVEVELAPLTGSPAPGPVPTPVYAFADELATERIFVEFRSKHGDDAGLPQSSPDGSDWVLVRLLLGRSTHLLAALGAVAGAAAYVRYADLHVRVIDQTPNRVKLRITSGAGWPRRELTSKITLNELSEGGPAIASGTSDVALAWTGTDDRLNAAVSTDGGRTFGPKMHPVQESDHPPALTGGDLYISWTGTDDRLNVGELFGVFALGQPATLPETSDAGPALARDRHGTLFLAWTGEDDFLNIIMSTDDGY
ncbi:MAG TPA: hypothetical protein VIU87_00980, partial [Mycobacterium sp.]